MKGKYVNESVAGPGVWVSHSPRDGGSPLCALWGPNIKNNDNNSDPFLFT